jgi:hypothetical protein
MGHVNSFFRLLNKRNIFSLTSPIFAIFLCFYLGVILPAHHHSDEQQHDDCMLCISQQQPLITEIVFTLPVFVPVIIAFYPPAINTGLSTFTSLFQSRAPPAYS